MQSRKGNLQKLLRAAVGLDKESFADCCILSTSIDRSRLAPAVIHVPYLTMLGKEYIIVSNLTSQFATCRVCKCPNIIVYFFVPRIALYNIIQPTRFSCSLTGFCRS